MKRSDKRARLRREIIGRWGFEPVVRWVAHDTWTGRWVGYGKTRKECEKDCREHGYVPERG